ncbi:2062_t:CDS:2 [Paraglomus occultum]|uniref:D-arabinono-1,4-lactone oxidase n=1 Tax=Paraglomus occultum TaxID=144539 RepID=A0A9N9C4F1_9GLOM|nr:2062_t:CDS:2 [Paraglomus occultum]
MDPQLKKISSRYHVFENWAHTFICEPELYFTPETEDEVEKIVIFAKAKNKSIKVIGAGHSPSDLACTKDFMINLDNLNRVLEINREEKTVSVQAGISLNQLNQELWKNGLAMSNIGSISDQSLAGAISTATHGTGINFGNISTQVTELTLITATRGTLTCSEKTNPDIFKAALCNLGALGIIIRITLKCEPAFRLEAIQTPAKFDEILNNLDHVVHSAEHVRFWWFPHTDDCVLWKANRTIKEPNSSTIGYIRETLLGYHLYQFLLYLTRLRPSTIPRLARHMFKIKYSTPTCIIDDSYKVFNIDCLFPQYVNEWAIPWEKTPEALRKINQWTKETNSFVHFPVEVRFVDKDDIWLSPSYGCKVCYIGIIMYRPYRVAVPYKEYWKAYEQIMRSLGGRPHWAKAHTMSVLELEKCYPKFNDFKKLMHELDPNGMFLNAYLRRHILGEVGEDVDTRLFKAKL